ncbi:PTS sugar transporter subunit IIA [Rothia terrae]|uniref:PTS glucose transporter subunit IIA n=1 Tax=Rothia terrae TaxID=396015 RepID=A0A7H2BF24_9MICC|nr:PTS glucose transporter subunit IIA [Rothia terrae]QNV38270.1 PTS glucose transporter subunit IIA [Rothia terrae]
MAGFFSKLFGGKEDTAPTSTEQSPVQSGGEIVTLGAHLTGTVRELSEVSDPTFSTGALGPGVAIEPSEGKLYAPADGVLTVAFPTGHAVGIRTDEGLELLIHIGFDTVELDGQHFDIKVAKGDIVKRGDLLVEFDVDQIKRAGYEVTTPLVATNHRRLVTGTSLIDGVSTGSQTAHGADLVTFSIDASA